MIKIVILTFTFILFAGFIPSCNLNRGENMDSFIDNQIDSNVYVTNIVDISGVGGAESDIEEIFFEDEKYIYIFGNPKSDYLLVEYSDGNSEKLKDALQNGRIEISDLEKFGIKFYAESKTIDSIVDIAERDNLSTDSAIEPFYADDNYIYSFSSIRSQYIIVTFKDGTQKNIKEAISDGSVKICDLDWFDISYLKEIK